MFKMTMTIAAILFLAGATAAEAGSWHSQDQNRAQQDGLLSVNASMLSPGNNFFGTNRPSRYDGAPSILNLHAGVGGRDGISLNATVGGEEQQSCDYCGGVGH